MTWRWVNMMSIYVVASNEYMLSWRTIIWWVHLDMLHCALCALWNHETRVYILIGYAVTHKYKLFTTTYKPRWTWFGRFGCTFTCEHMLCAVINRSALRSCESNSGCWLAASWSVTPFKYRRRTDLNVTDFGQVLYKCRSQLISNASSKFRVFRML